MKTILVVTALIAAATTQAGAQDERSPSHGHRQNLGITGDPRPLGFSSAQNPSGRVYYDNAPGGAYIDCDPRNPSSPVRCKPDGW